MKTKSKGNSSVNPAGRRRLLLILGGFAVIKKPAAYFFLNIIWLGSMFLLCPYLFATGILTASSVSLEGPELVELFQEMCLFTSVPTLPLAAYLCRRSLKRVAGYLVFSYKEELEGMTEIREEYAQRVTGINSIVNKMILAFTVSKTFFPPVLNYLKNERHDPIFNPFLPLKLYVPFDTANPLGFILAFSSQALFFLFYNLVLSVHMEKFVGHIYRFVAELELLCYSLNHIERRAFFRLHKARSTDWEGFSRKLYESPDFQRCLLACLKENLQHHIAILRLKNAIKPYIESVTCLSTAYFVSLLAVSSSLILQESSGRVALIFFVILLMSVYLLVSWNGQMITDKSADLKDSLYSTPWATCGKRYRVLLGTMMANSQEPIVLHAKGFRNDISLENFSNMTSVAYKIFNVLR